MTEEYRAGQTRLMLLSIRPRHVRDILNGTKTVELRRVRPHVLAGQPVAVYGTAPMAAVVATCRVSAIEASTPSKIKHRYLHRSAISGKEFDDYFHGSCRAVAIHLSAITALNNVVTLEELRSRQHSYNPPQTWHFYDHLRLTQLVGGHLAHSHLARMLGS